MKKSPLILIACLLCLNSCDTSQMLEKFADDEKEQIALDYIDLLRSGEYQKILDDLSPKLSESADITVIEKMGAFFPKKDFTSRELIGYRVNQFNNNPAVYNVSYQYGFEDKWLVTNVAFHQEYSGNIVIDSFYVYPLKQSLQETHRFTFSGKGLGHYITFAACILIPIFIVVTLVGAIKTKMEKRKWLWIIFILLGIFTIRMNWSTGQFSFQPLSFQLLGSSFQSAGLYAPWMFGFSIPLGAILSWFKKCKSYKAGAANPLPPSTPEDC